MKVTDIFETTTEALRVWLNPQSGKTIAVTTVEDHAATVYEHPEQFGIAPAAVDQIERRYRDHMMDAVVLLAMKRGWVRINDEPDGYSVPLVMAANERLAQQGVAWLSDHIALPAVQVEILSHPQQAPMSRMLRGHAVADFAQA